MFLNDPGTFFRNHIRSSGFHNTTIEELEERVEELEIDMKFVEQQVKICSLIKKSVSFAAVFLLWSCLRLCHF